MLRVRSSKNVETSPKIARSESRSRANFATCADERQPRQSGILDLHGDEQSVCRIEGVDGQKPERRWAIDLHVIVVRAFFSRLSLPIRPANVHSTSASRMLAGRMSKSCSSVLFASAMETLPARTSKTVRFSVCGSRAQIFAQVPPSVQIEQQYLFFGIPGKLNTWIMRVVVLPMPPFGFAIAQ